MAEFNEVMRQWRRMCATMDKEHGEHACDVCALNGCTAVYDTDGTEDYADIEQKVMEWAAEHPEPAYPTWYEYLSNMYRAADGMSVIGRQPIPAEIAQKLGIEPMEG